MTKNIFANAVALAIVLSLLSSQPGSAAQAPTKVFKNCTDLRRTYPGGVSKSKSSRNIGGALKKSPVVNAKVYLENKKMDRDGDGMACEN